MSKLPYPPMTDGADLRRFLFRLVDELNNSLNSIGTYHAGAAPSNAEGGGSTTGSSGSLDDATANELKSLIIKNSKDVQMEIDGLSSKYVAQSEYGTFIKDIENELSQTAIVISGGNLPNVPDEWSASPHGRAIVMGKETNSDRYYILVQSNGNLYTGCALNGSEKITWYKKG